jgi:hypothetical protein
MISWFLMSQKKRKFLYNEMCHYPADQVPPRTSSRSRQKARHANHTLPRVHNLSMNRIAQGSSGATTCPTALAPAAQPGAAPESGAGGSVVKPLRQDGLLFQLGRDFINLCQPFWVNVERRKFFWITLFGNISQLKWIILKEPFEDRKYLGTHLNTK